MQIVFKLLLLTALVRMGIVYDPFQERPWLLATFYALASGFLTLAFDAGSPLMVLALAVAAFLLSWLYFALLARLAEAGPFWWILCLVGLPLVLL